MKKLLSLLLLPFVLFAKTDQEQPFVVGMTSGYAPFVSLNEKGSYEGFDIDIATELANKLNRPLVLKDFGSMPGLMLALKQGKADALIWAISITDQRKQSMEMIHYQGEKVEEIAIVFWKEIPKGIASFSDLGKKTVSVEAGSYQESVLAKYPEIELKNLTQISDAILALKYGKTNACSIDDSLFPTLKRQYPELQKLNVPLAPDDISQGNGICVSRSNTALAAQVRKAVEELKADGTIAKLEKKWGLIL